MTEPAGDATRDPMDTIAARATAQGVAAVAVVRLSGPRALEVLGRVAPELEGVPEGRRATLTRVRDPEDGSLLDRAVVTVFPGPGSYTGEDVVEISGHGGYLTPSLVLEACLAAGAREAEAGEFTRRAYLNGKMDLVQAEAVLDLVEGRNRALHGAALHQLERGLSSRIADLREGLVHLEALLTHHIDFPEEDEPPVPVFRIVDKARAVEERMETLLETAPEGELLREGAVTVLAGRPNSGKSSLFNALLGRERAIVTEVAGTTRDALEAVVSLEGFPFRLVDTAGLRETGDEVERMGIEVARRYLSRADLVLFCAEAGRPLTDVERGFLNERGGVPVVRVRTKADLLAGDSGGSEPGDPPSRDAGSAEPRTVGSGAPSGNGEAGGSGCELRVSVESGRGLARLRKLLPGLVYRGLVQAGAEVPVLTRRRQTRRVEEALDEVRAFGDALDRGVPPEVASTHLRPAETALEELLGVISPDDVLERVFRDFCIGK